MAPDLNDRKVDFVTACKALQEILEQLPPARPPTYVEMQTLVIGMSNYFWMAKYNTETNKYLRMKLLSTVTRREIGTTYDLTILEAKAIRKFIFNGYSTTPAGEALLNGIQSLAKAGSIQPAE